MNTPETPKQFLSMVDRWLSTEPQRTWHFREGAVAGLNEVVRGISLPKPDGLADMEFEAYCAGKSYARAAWHGYQWEFDDDSPSNSDQSTTTEVDMKTVAELAEQAANEGRIDHDQIAAIVEVSERLAARNPDLKECEMKPVEWLLEFAEALKQEKRSGQKEDPLPAATVPEVKRSFGTVAELARTLRARVYVAELAVIGLDQRDCLTGAIVEDLTETGDQLEILAEHVERLESSADRQLAKATLDLLKFTRLSNCAVWSIEARDRLENLRRNHDANDPATNELIEIWSEIIRQRTIERAQAYAGQPSIDEVPA